MSGGYSVLASQCTTALAVEHRSGTQASATVAHGLRSTGSEVSSTKDLDALRTWNLPDQGVGPVFPALAGDSYPLPPGSPLLAFYQQKLWLLLRH